MRMHNFLALYNSPPLPPRLCCVILFSPLWEGMGDHCVLYNDTCGGYKLSDTVCERLGDDMAEMNIPRHDPTLLAVVEELGLEASSGSRTCSLQVMHIEGEWYDIQTYDGAETVRDGFNMSITRATGSSHTHYRLNVSFQELYDAGYITERVPRLPLPKNANA